MEHPEINSEGMARARIILRTLKKLSPLMRSFLFTNIFNMGIPIDILEASINGASVAKFTGQESTPPFRLLTGQEHFLRQLEGLLEVDYVRSRTLARARDYLNQVRKGDGTRPHCPFVQAIEAENGYYVLPFEEHPKEVDLGGIIERLEAEFKEVSSRKTTKDQAVDPTTMVAAFGHPRAVSRRFCSGLTDGRNQHRLHFLQQGLMLAHMHPFHSLGSASTRRAEPGSQPLYVAEIPLLMVRRMHAPDHVFMKTRSEKTAYGQFFDPVVFERPITT